MDEAFEATLDVPKRLYGTSDSASSVLLAAVLGWLGTCASRCLRCREECSFGGTSRMWPKVVELILAGLKGFRGGSEQVDLSTGMTPDAYNAAVSACQVASQAACHRNISVEGHEQVYVSLITAVITMRGEELTLAAAEALVYMTLRCNDAKVYVAKLLSHDAGESICNVLDKANAGSSAKVQALLRSIAAAKPSSSVFEAFGSGRIMEAVITNLCRHSGDHKVQRWGLAALGALALVDVKLADQAAEGGATCITWVLGSDALTGAPFVEQEALFCAHSLLHSDAAKAQLAPTKKGGRLPGLTASAIATGLRNDGGSSEAALWGLRIFEIICQTRATLIEPYVGVVVDAMLAEGCLHKAMIAGANTVSHLAAVVPSANIKLKQARVQLVKTLQQRAHAAASTGTEAGRAQEKELLDWVQVLIDILGPARPPKESDELQSEEEDEEAMMEDELALAGASAQEGTKSEKGTKSNPGTKSVAGTKDLPNRSKSQSKIV
eukprot:TRINITY_DN14470_c0_g1_i1.p1 TRINITY_DN14470_c0_g1~~TRINITY_DN14470_c0_g1_i1.p1  ORF type:complete len:525 (+),score=125.84 TRINITY_DN14470_c0_g1_i1:91-1575(+)